MTFATMITAHAGAENTPANDLNGLRVLCALGADAVEVDVREAGGRLMLSHDARRGAEGLTSLEDALDEIAKHDGLAVNCDLKHFGLTRGVAALAAARGLTGRVVLTGDLDDGEIAFAREAGLDVWLNDSLLPEGADPLDGAAEKGLSVANLDLRAASPLLSRAAGRLSVWTIDDPAELARLLRAGVRNITTRTPVQALRLRAALRPTDEEAAAAFHRVWDAFPGAARLVGADHIVRAANAPARRAGFAEGVDCRGVPTSNRHRGCQLARAAGPNGAACADVSGGLTRVWLPVEGRPDLAVHFSLRPQAEDAR